MVVREVELSVLGILDHVAHQRYIVGRELSAVDHGAVAEHNQTGVNRLQILRQAPNFGEALGSAREPESVGSRRTHIAFENQHVVVNFALVLFNLLGGSAQRPAVLLATPGNESNCSFGPQIEFEQ